MSIEELDYQNKSSRASTDIEVGDLKYKYPEYDIFIPVSDCDFVIFRKKVGETTFGVKDKFTVAISKDIKIHYTQLHLLL